MNQFSDIIEVKEAGMTYCNKLMALGYRLLVAGQTNWEAARKTANTGVNPTFIRTDFRYVLGRTADQEPFPDDEWRSRRKAEVEASA